MKIAVAQFEGPTTMRMLPLAAGILASTVTAAPDLADVTVDIHWLRVGPADAAEALRGYQVVGLSIYTWNERYSLEVARLLKASSPTTIIVAGGPSVPRRFADAERWLMETALDVLVAGEGERPFTNIVRAVLRGEALQRIAGVTTRHDGRVVQVPRGPRLAPEDFGGIGSPYLDGTFDRLLAAAPGRYLGAAFETNRGCPFSCTFCDWGAATESKVQELPLERVMGELRWAADNGLPYLYFIDANFGIRKRDLAIIEGIGDIARDTGYPRFVYFHLTKNATEKNLATVEALADAGIGTQVSLSMQDFDRDVLLAIKRDNIDPERALELRARANARGIPTNNELMLGLPAQTGRSFRDSLVRALTPYPDDGFFLFVTRLLVNAELADPDTITRYGIEVRDVPSLPRDPREDVHVVEYERVVVGSAAMSTSEWRDAFVFGFLFTALVNQRLLATTLRALPQSALVPVVDALAAIPRIRDALLARADALLASEAMSAPIDGLGDVRREPVEVVTAVIMADWPRFIAEVAAIVGDAPEVADALAWDAFITPELGARSGARTFRAGRVRRQVTQWPTREAWFDAFIAQGWAKQMRVSLTQ